MLQVPDRILVSRRAFLTVPEREMSLARQEIAAHAIASCALRKSTFELGIIERVSGKSRNYHDNSPSDDSRSGTRVDAFASGVRLDRAGHSKHTRRGTRLACTRSRKQARSDCLKRAIPTGNSRDFLLSSAYPQPPRLRDRIMPKVPFFRGGKGWVRSRF